MKTSKSLECCDRSLTGSSLLRRTFPCSTSPKNPPRSKVPSFDGSNQAEISIPFLGKGRKPHGISSDTYAPESSPPGNDRSLLGTAATCALDHRFHGSSSHMNARNSSVTGTAAHSLHWDEIH